MYPNGSCFPTRGGTIFAPGSGRAFFGAVRFIMLFFPSLGAIAAGGRIARVFRAVSIDANDRLIVAAIGFMPILCNEIAKVEGRHVFWTRRREPSPGKIVWLYRENKATFTGKLSGSSSPRAALREQAGVLTLLGIHFDGLKGTVYP
jgi:hypothetical protein